MKRIALLLIVSAIAARAADSTAVGSTRDEHRARMVSAIEARDYDAWKAERDAWGAKGQAGQKVTKENFETFVRLHEAVQAGRTDEAAALRTQLGLGAGAGGMGAGKANCRGGKGGQGGHGGQGKGAMAGSGSGAGTGAGCRRGR